MPTKTASPEDGPEPTKKAVVEGVVRDLYQEEGKVMPERVVELAKDRHHPLHKYFEWNDKVAGHEYRVEQAREMIREIEIVVLTADESYKVRAFQPRRYVGRDGGGYMPTDEITAAEYPMLLRRVQADMLALKARYEHLAEFATLVRHTLLGEEEVG